MPAMVDPHFARTLTYICEHNEQGALGVVVNRPIDMTLQALFEQIDVPPGSAGADRTCRYISAVRCRSTAASCCTVRSAHWQSTLPVRDGIGLTTSKDILQAVGRGEGPEQILVTLGYAGWAPGQLEHELAQNAWLTVAAKPDVIFDMPAEERLAAAMELLGVDFASLSDTAGTRRCTCAPPMPRARCRVECLRPVRVERAGAAAAGSVLAFDFGAAPHRRRGRRSRAAHPAPGRTVDPVGAAHRARIASPAGWSTNGGRCCSWSACRSRRERHGPHPLAAPVRASSPRSLEGRFRLPVRSGGRELLLLRGERCAVPRPASAVAPQKSAPRRCGGSEILAVLFSEIDATA